MKWIFLLLLIPGLSSASSRDSEQDEKDEKKENLNSVCRVPKESFFKTKFEEWFHTASLERELKEVLSLPVNYERREAIKANHRRTYFADRFIQEEIRTKLKEEFAGIAVSDPRRLGVMENFPVKGANAQLGAADDGSLEISAEAFPEVEQKFLSPEIRKKLGNQIKVRYHYPIDRFEYSLVYEGKEYPLKEVVSKLQEDWEVECIDHAERIGIYKKSLIHQINEGSSKQ